MATKKQRARTRSASKKPAPTKAVDIGDIDPIEADWDKAVEPHDSAQAYVNEDATTRDQCQPEPRNVGVAYQETPKVRRGGRYIGGTEEWREYDYDGRVYRIDYPEFVYLGGTTHIVTDGEGVNHCVPAPGVRGCVLRWKGRVAF